MWRSTVSFRGGATPTDRRFVTTRNHTPTGSEILADLDKPVAELHRASSGACPKDELKRLTVVTGKLRGSDEQT